MDMIKTLLPCDKFHKLKRTNKKSANITKLKIIVNNKVMTNSSNFQLFCSDSLFINGLF